MKERLKNFHLWCVRYHVYFYAAMVVLLIADVVSKKVFESLLLDADQHRITVIPGFFTLSLVYNTGAFSGMLGSNLAGQIILTLLSLVCGAGMIFAFVRFDRKWSFLEKIGLTLAIPGTIGNLIDRALMIFGLQEGVIDFLEFDLGFMVWNTFNFADTFLVVGVIAFAIGYGIRDYANSKKERKAREEFYDSKAESEEKKDE